MVVTMMKDMIGSTPDAVIITAKDNRFREAYGEFAKCKPNEIYPTLASMADWCNNELHEEFLIEMD